MRMNIDFALIVIVAVFMSGCAVTYQAPAPLNTSITANVQASKDVLLKTVRRIIVFEGFQVLSADESSGTVSTAFKNYRLNPSEADCGCTMGIDYLKDNRTSTRVAYNIIIDEQRITVLANVEGEYKPGAVDQDITLTCNSRGLLEQRLMQKIQDAIVGGK